MPAGVRLLCRVRPRPPKHVTLLLQLLLLLLLLQDLVLVLLSMHQLLDRRHRRHAGGDAWELQGQQRCALCIWPSYSS